MDDTNTYIVSVTVKANELLLEYDNLIAAHSSSFSDSNRFNGLDSAVAAVFDDDRDNGRKTTFEQFAGHFPDTLEYMRSSLVGDDLTTKNETDDDEFVLASLDHFTDSYDSAWPEVREMLHGLLFARLGALRGCWLKDTSAEIVQPVSTPAEIERGYKLLTELLAVIE